MWVTGVELHILLNKYITVGQITRPTVIYLFNYTEYSCLFEKKTLGKHTLAIMMTNISIAESLSKHDTNHCVRATCIPVLSEACFEARQIVTACIDLCSSLSIIWFLKLKESNCKRRKRQLYSV
jgi:hypothetical protein